MLSYSSITIGYRSVPVLLKCPVAIVINVYMGEFGMATFRLVQLVLNESTIDLIEHRSARIEIVYDILYITSRSDAKGRELYFFSPLLLFMALLF